MFTVQVIIHTPVMTSNDCEGAGEVFTVQVSNILFSLACKTFVVGVWFRNGPSGLTKQMGCKCLCGKKVI